MAFHKCESQFAVFLSNFYTFFLLLPYEMFNILCVSFEIHSKYEKMFIDEPQTNKQTNKHTYIQTNNNRHS